MNGAELVAAERQRQIDAEGWTPEHDDEHTEGELSSAGASYALWASQQVAGLLALPGPEYNVRAISPRVFFPSSWDRLWWKPSDDPVRNLVKAGALIVAEIDRLQRAATLPDEVKAR